MIRLIRTTVIEYEPNPELYPDNFTEADMAKMDCEEMNRDFAIFSGNIGKKTETVEYEILEQGNAMENGIIVNNSAIE